MSIISLSNSSRPLDTCMKEFCVLFLYSLFLSCKCEIPSPNRFTNLSDYLERSRIRANVWTPRHVHYQIFRPRIRLLPLVRRPVLRLGSSEAPPQKVWRTLGRRFLAGWARRRRGTVARVGSRIANFRMWFQIFHSKKYVIKYIALNGIKFISM